MEFNIRKKLYGLENANHKLKKTDVTSQGAFSSKSINKAQKMMILANPTSSY